MSHADANVLPPGALYLCLGLVGLSLAGVTLARVAHFAPAASPALLRAATHPRALAAADLRFTDRADGAVVIEDVTAGRQAGLVAPGSKSGFIRGVMRGLARDRHLRGIGDQVPFRLTEWSDGELSLADPATGRTIELTAFGATNRAAFAALLPGGRA